MRANSDLIVVSRGKFLNVDGVAERVQAGAHMVQVFDNMFMDGGPYELFELKEMLKSH